MWFFIDFILYIVKLLTIFSKKNSMVDLSFLFIISIFLYIIFFIFLIIKKLKTKKIIIISLFYFYIVSLLWATLFPIPIEWLDEIWKFWLKNNYIPFNSILDITFNNNLSLYIKTKQILWNIIIFIPLWFFIQLLWKIKLNYKKAILIWLLSSLIIETIQFLISLLLWFNYKISDIDDIILNTLWFIIWFFMYKLFKVD